VHGAAMCRAMWEKTNRIRIPKNIETTMMAKARPHSLISALLTWSMMRTKRGSGVLCAMLVPVLCGGRRGWDGLPALRCLRCLVGDADGALRSQALNLVGAQADALQDLCCVFAGRQRQRMQWRHLAVIADRMIDDGCGLAFDLDLAEHLVVQRLWVLSQVVVVLDWGMPQAKG